MTPHPTPLAPEDVLAKEPAKDRMIKAAVKLAKQWRKEGLTFASVSPNCHEFYEATLAFIAAVEGPKP